MRIIRIHGEDRRAILSIIKRITLQDRRIFNGNNVIEDFPMREKKNDREKETVV